MSKQLPHLLSDCIRVALADLEIAEQHPDFKINMAWWLHPTSTGCGVCFAGSVMARLNGWRVPPNDVFPNNYGAYDGTRLDALDDIREGSVLLAVGKVYSEDVASWLTVSDYEGVPEYDDDPEGFKVCMAEIADTLEKEGL